MGRSARARWWSCSTKSWWTPCSGFSGTTGRWSNSGTKHIHEWQELVARWEWVAASIKRIWLRGSGVKIHHVGFPLPPMLSLGPTGSYTTTWVAVSGSSTKSEYFNEKDVISYYIMWPEYAPIDTICTIKLFVYLSFAMISLEPKMLLIHNFLKWQEWTELQVFFVFKRGNSFVRTTSNPYIVLLVSACAQEAEIARQRSELKQGTTAVGSKLRTHGIFGFLNICQESKSWL